MYRLLTLFSLLSSTVFGQVANSEGPISWRTTTAPEELSHHYIAKGFDAKKIAAEDAENDQRKDQPWRFGYKYDTDIQLSDGAFEILPNGDRLWKYQISCPGALSINLLLENYLLPEGATLHLYDNQRTNFVGAYTSANNRSDGMLGTELVHGSSIIVEYFEPSTALFSGNFSIQSIVHGYRSLDPIQQELSKALDDAGDCHYDVACTLGNGWEDEIRAVAMIIVNGNGVCSGALINNACEDGRPLLLSANHCLTSSTSNWAFRFNWKAAPGSETCAQVGTTVDSGPPYDQTANGATVLANGTAADFLLLELDQLTPTQILDWNLFFVGWDRSDSETLTNGTIIHHPKGDVMKISRESDAPYHNTISNTSVWWIDQYELGVTEGGSSGAPLFDQNHHLVGQLFGGTASCSGTNPNGNSDYYGRFGIAWTNGLDTILGSAICGSPIVVDGWEPDAPDVFDDANLQFIAAPNGDLCSGTFTPEIILRNAGDNNLTSCTLHYAVDGGTELTQNWSGNLSPNGFEYVTLTTMSAPSGSHTFHAYTTSPNGTADPNTVNDSLSINFTLAAYTAETHILIETDCYGYETAWELKDLNNNLVASGGNALVPPGGIQTALSSDPYSYGNEITIDEKLCLTEGCYVFTIYDDWGDGLEGTSQFGCNVDGNYTITDEFGVVGSLQNVAFGNSETITICVEKVGIEEDQMSLYEVFPNPTNSLLQISGTNNISFEGEQYRIIDNTGHVIQHGLLLSDQINVSSLASGSYFLSVGALFMPPVKFVVLH